jgi:hypothetical protein
VNTADVTLPADHVHNHVRLGYAATEHGWQSDTVETSVAVTSAVTSRRGLYVAATRGSDVNTLCVVTESDDIAEARDVLEAVIAADRADVPATTQRRNLASATHHKPLDVAARPTPRCEIPEWFSSALENAHRTLRDAQTGEARRAQRQAEAHAALADADRVAADVAAATAADRDALQYAEARVADARRRQTAAAHQLDNAPRRQRRSLRGDLNVAEQQLERAEAYLARTQQRAAPAVERYAVAVENQRTARQHLQAISQMDATPPVIGQHRLHIRALNTWKRWAEGHEVPDPALRTTVAVLAQKRGPEQQLVVPLGQDLATRPVEPSARGLSREPDTRVHVQRQDFGIER